MASGGAEGGGEHIFRYVHRRREGQSGRICFNDDALVVLGCWWCTSNEKNGRNSGVEFGRVLFVYTYGI